MRRSDGFFSGWTFVICKLLCLINKSFFFLFFFGGFNGG